MIAKRLIFLIVAAFIAGNLILIFIKYNSEKNINNLIDGNEKLIDEFQINNELKNLEGNLWLIESKIRGAIATNDVAFMEGLEMQMANTSESLAKLQAIKEDDSTKDYIKQLDGLVQAKLRFSNAVLDAYKNKGKKAAENIIASHQGKLLSDSILFLAEKISSVRKNRIFEVTASVDKSVRKVQGLDSSLIIFVIISAAVLFWYIANTIRTQNRLILQVKHSEQKVKEAALIKENFLAKMSHEIRTPMNAILGFTNLLQRKNLDSESSLYVQTIQRSGENLLAIINDILDLSKIEAGMMRIEIAPFSLRGLLHSVETLFRTKANEKGIRFFTVVDESLPDTLEGDATRLTQILVNLISNAIKFTNRGSVSVAFNNKKREGNTVVVEIKVSDTGIGIDREKLDRIFDRFQQADDAVTREYGGTGLGLSIAKELVVLQQGSIAAESQTGKGTTFYVTIPYKIAAEQMQAGGKTVEQTVANSSMLQDAYILVVEDNEVNQTLLQHLFRNWQVRFDMAGNGIEAIEKLKTGVYDLILMDIQMPQMDGYTATRQIRDQLKINTPIVAMTAHAMAGEREKCLSSGMNEYISKPIREEQLWKLIIQFVPLKKDTLTKADAADAAAGNQYQYIDLAYMKEVSAGNKEYEKEVTTQFIEGVPRALKALSKAMEENDTTHLRDIAHNLKTTVSVMGLNEKLEPYLDAIEYGENDDQDLKKNIEAVQRICTGALPEAKHYLASITS